jgi:flagellar motility protein MotE (MotC chaperone)
MMRFLRDLRLIPIALIASACLLALKTADLVLDSPYFFAADNNTQAAREAELVRTAGGPAWGKPDSWAKQMFNFPDGAKTQDKSQDQYARQNLPQIVARRSNSAVAVDRDNSDITGSVTEPPANGDAKPDASKPDANRAGAGKDGKTDSKPDAKADAKKDPKAAPAPVDPPAPAFGRIIPTEGPVPTGAERAILERLQQRREEIDTRARELDMRESLIQSAEKRIDSHITELKDVETRIKTETEQKNEAEDARLKGLITIYENMKPRDAAKIFNGLDDTVLVAVAAKINPRAMADILAQMQPDVAQRLTVELASKTPSGPQSGSGPADLPKIDGQPTANNQRNAK